MAQTVLMSTFWNTIVYSVKVSNPLICVLRLVNWGKKPAMGYIYKGMDRAKKEIEKPFNEAKKDTKKSLK